MKKRKRLKYSATLPAKMYGYFAAYDEAQGAPSFEKFALAIGATAEDIELFREHREFDRAYRECSEIRRDYLIDRALTKRFDPSFVKYVLEAEGGDGGKLDEGLAIRVEVV